MKSDRLKIMVIFLFLIVAVVVSWKALLSNGNFVYRDEWTILNIEAFKEYFFHIHKQHTPNLDFHKRVPELWIHFFIGYETYDKIKFTLLAFLTLLNSFYVSNKILKHENIHGKKRLLTASFTAISYLVNPLNTQVFLSYYPTINYVLFPLFFYFLYNGIKNHNLFSTLISALIASFMFLMVVHSLLYIILSFPIILVALLKRPLKSASLFINIAVFSLVFVSLTAFIIFPYLHIAMISGPSEGYHTLVQGMLDIFSSVAHLPKAMLMDFHVFWWPYVDYAYPFGELFFLLAFLFSSILIVQAIFDRNEWATMSLVGLVLLFFLSKGNNPPFPSIYEFLNFRLPVIGWLFRVPMKFAHIIPFFFSILFLRCSVFTAKRSKSFFYAFSICYVAFLVTFSWPFFTGDMAGYLTKTNFDSKVADLTTINSIVTENNPTIIAYGIKSTVKKDLSTDVLAGDTYIMRELRVYENYKNWSGLHIMPFLGAQYLLAPVEIEGDIKLYSEQVSKGPHYSLFRMKTDTQTIQIPSTSYLCYCHPTTARSIIRDSPQIPVPELLTFPYSQLDFPREHIDAADYVVVDSVPLDFTSIEKENTFSYFTQTFESKPSKKWSRNLVLSSEVDADKKAAEGFEYGFGEGFAITKAEPLVTSVKSCKDVLNISEMEFRVHDKYTAHDDNGSFIIRPRTGPYFSTVTSDLNVPSGSEYELYLSLASESLESFTAEVIIQDYGGDIYPIIIMESKGSFVAEKNLTFFVPYNASRVTLLFSSKTPEGNASSYELRSFKLRRLTYEMQGEKISSSFYTNEEGKYDVYLRLLKSPGGGEVGLYLDDEPLGIFMTKNNASHLYWEKIYSGTLPLGRHELTVEQLGGFNAINLGYVRKTGTDEVNLSDKTLIYRLTGKNDFYGANAMIIEDTSSSTFYCLKSSEPVTAVVEVLSDGVYNLSYAVSGPAEILIDDSVAGRQVHLEKGRHVIEIRPVNASGISVDHVTLIKEGNPKEHNATMVNYTRLDPSTYSVWVNSSTPFFLSFGRAYAPEWVAFANGKAYSPVPSYDTVNAYYIDETGLNQITIEYVPQKTFYAGIIFGIVGLAFAVIYVARSKT